MIKVAKIAISGHWYFNLQTKSRLKPAKGTLLESAYY